MLLKMTSLSKLRNLPASLNLRLSKDREAVLAKFRQRQHRWSLKLPNEEAGLAK